MQQHPKLGEIIIPGPPRNTGIRSFILTEGAAGGRAPEMLFGLLAADAPKKIVDKLVDRLIDEVRPAFFSGTGDAEARYEETLKQANKSILAYLHEQKLSLPGIKLRGMMAALSDDALLVSNRGSLRGLLIMTKQGKTSAMRLFAEGSDTATNPKFFSSFQQGVLPPGSVLVAGTKELFTAVDEPFLKRVFTERDPSEAGRELRKGLSDKTAVAALTLAMPSEAPAEAEASPGTPVPAPRLTSPKPRRRKGADLPMNMDIGEVGAKSIEGLLVFILTYLKLIPKALFALARGIITFFRLLGHAPRAARALADPAKRADLASGAKSFPRRMARGGLNRFNALPTRSKAHLLLLIAVSALFVHGILYSFHRHSEALAAKAYEAKLAEIGQLQTDLETSLIIGNDRRSHDALARLESLIAELPEEEADTKAELTEELREKRDRLRRYVRIKDPEVLASYEDAEGRFAGGAFAWFDRALYLFAPSGDAVKSFGLDGSVTDVAIDAPAPIRDVAPARTGILIAFEDGQVGFWRPDAPEVTVYPDLNVGRSPILYYQSRLYSMRDDGMMVRRPILDGRLGAPTDVLLSPSDLSEATGIAADGAAYLLSSAGDLRKYLKGSVVDGFDPPVIDPTPRRADDLWADVDSRWIVFLERDEDRIIMVDSATGRMAAQLVSDDFGDISSVAVDPGGEQAYLHSGTRILSVPLKGPGIN